MKPLRILCGILCALCVELQTSAGLVLDAPGHVVVEGETTTARGGEPGAAFTLVDWLGRAVEGASGVFGDDGTAAIPPLPTGYYRMVDDDKRTTATLAVVSPPRPFQDGEAADFKPQRGASKADGRFNGGFLAADTGPI